MNKKPMTCVEAGKRGAVVRHSKTPKERAEITRKAVETRRKNDPETYIKMGKAGAESRHAKSEKEKATINKKMVQTRLKNGTYKSKDKL